MHLFKKLIFPLFLGFFLFLGFLATPAKAQAYSVNTLVYVDKNGNGIYEKSLGETCPSSYTVTIGSSAKNLTSNCPNYNVISGISGTNTFRFTVPSGYEVSNIRGVIVVDTQSLTSNQISVSDQSSRGIIRVRFGMKQTATTTVRQCNQNGGTCKFGGCGSSEYSTSGCDSPQYCCISKKDNGNRCSSDSTDYECKSNNCEFDRHEDGINYY